MIAPEAVNAVRSPFCRWCHQPIVLWRVKTDEHGHCSAMISRGRFLRALWPPVAVWARLPDGHKGSGGGAWAIDLCGGLQTTRFLGYSSTRGRTGSTMSNARLSRFPASTCITPAAHDLLLAPCRLRPVAVLVLLTTDHWPLNQSVQSDQPEHIDDGKANSWLRRS